MVAPRDDVLDPSSPIATRGTATFDEVIDALSSSDGVPLVGAGDAEAGPYSRCIVPVIDVGRYTQQG